MSVPSLAIARRSRPQVAAAAGFPQVAAEATFENSTASDTHAVALPAGIAAGNLLLMLVGAGADRTFSPPSGWTEILDALTAGDNGAAFAAYRIADGAEGATATVTLTGGTSQVVARTLRITGAHASAAPEASTLTTATSTSQDPPSLTPSWGAADTLWIAAEVNGDRTTTISTYPTDYTNGAQIVNTAGGGAISCALATARRELNAVSENPGAFTLSASENGGAFTVAVRPTA